jgi:hypothetical protein
LHRAPTHTLRSLHVAVSDRTRSLRRSRSTRRRCGHGRQREQLLLLQREQQLRHQGRGPFHVTAAGRSTSRPLAVRQHGRWPSLNNEANRPSRPLATSTFCCYCARSSTRCAALAAGDFLRARGASIVHTQRASGLAGRDRASATADAQAASAATAPALQRAAQRSLSVTFFALEALRSYTRSVRLVSQDETAHRPRPTRKQLLLLVVVGFFALGCDRCR